MKAKKNHSCFQLKIQVAFLDPDTWKDKHMRIVTEWLSTCEMAEIASRVTRKKVVPQEIEEAIFLGTKNTKYLVANKLFNSKFLQLRCVTWKHIDSWHPPKSGVREPEL
jgi:hypothetical protein